MTSCARLILVVGSYNRDTTLLVDRFPDAGETISARGSHAAHGGKGSNQAVQAARFGASVAMVASIGDDTAGREAIEMWRAERIDATLVQSGQNPTGSATILSRKDGQNLIVVDPGANADLAFPTDLADTHMAAAGLVLAQMETPQDATLAAFQAARRHGIATMLNAAPIPDRIPPELLGLVDILVVNEGEAKALLPHGATGDAEDAVKALLSQVNLAIVLTLGERGAILYHRDGSVIRQPAIASKVVDTTGAGDALIGAFAANYVASGDFSAGLRWGVAAGSFACTVQGAVPSFATLRQIIAQNGSAVTRH